MTISLVVAAVYVLVIDDGLDDVTVVPVSDMPIALIDHDQPLLQVSFPIKRGKFFNKLPPTIVCSFHVFIINLTPRTFERIPENKSGFLGTVDINHRHGLAKRM